MIQLFKYKWNRIAVRIAGISFLIETLFALVMLFTKDDTLFTVGIVLIVLYIPITLLILLIILVNTLVNFKDLHEHVLTIILVSLNFPLALLYSYFLNN